MSIPEQPAADVDVTLQVKIPTSLDKRLLAMRARLAERAGVPAAKLPKAEVARQALDRGLRAMEADLALPEGGSGSAGVRGRAAASGWMTTEPRGPQPAARVAPLDEPVVTFAVGDDDIKGAVSRKVLLEHNGIADTGQSEASLEPLARVYPRTPQAPEGTPEHSCPDCGEHHRDCPECGTTMGEEHSATCPWHGVYLIVSNTSTVLGTTADKQR